MKTNIKNLILVVLAGVVLSACGSANNQNNSGANSSGSQIKFQKEIGLNEEMTVESASGKMSFSVKEFGEKDKIGGVDPISGQTFYYTIFDIKGDAANNPPKYLVDLTVPQIVMLDSNSLASVGGAIGGAYNSDFTQEKNLTAYELVQTNQADWIHTATTWYTTKTDKPMIAIQYSDAQGNKQFIKINY